MRDSTGRPVAKGEEQIGSTMPMPMFCKEAMNHEFFLSSRSTKDLWLISKNCKSWSFILTNSTTRSTFSCWKIRFKTKVSSCTLFPSEALLWIKEVEMFDSVDEFKIFIDQLRGISMPEFGNAGREDCFSTEQNHP